MVLPSTWFIAAAAAVALSPTLAHPGEHHDASLVKRQIQARNAMATYAKRSLGSCAGTPMHRQLMERAVLRRAEAARKLRSKRGISGST